MADVAAIARSACDRHHRRAPIIVALEDPMPKTQADLSADGVFDLHFAKPMPATTLQVLLASDLARVRPRR